MPNSCSEVNGQHILIPGRQIPTICHAPPSSYEDAQGALLSWVRVMTLQSTPSSTPLGTFLLCKLSALCYLLSTSDMDTDGFISAVN